MLKRDFFLPTAKVEVQASCEQLLLFADRFLFQHQNERAAHSQRCSISVSLQLSEEPQSLLPKSSECVFAAHMYDVFVEDDSYWFLYNAGPALATINFKEDQPQLSIFLSSVIFEKGMEFAFRYFFPLLEFVLAREKIFPLHAAALSKNGKGLLLIAKGGGGKTTLSLTLPRYGYTMLSDDNPLLFVENSTVMLQSSLGGPKLLPTTTTMLPEYASAIAEADNLDGKSCCRFDKAFGEHYYINTPAVVGVLLDRDLSLTDTVCNPVSKTEFHRAIIECGALVLYPNLIPNEILRDRFDLISLFTKQISTYRLSYPNDGIPQAVRFFDDLLSNDNSEMPAQY